MYAKNKSKIEDKTKKMLLLLEGKKNDQKIKCC